MDIMSGIGRFRKEKREWRVYDTDPPEGIDVSG